MSASRLIKFNLGRAAGFHHHTQQAHRNHVFFPNLNLYNLGDSGRQETRDLSKRVRTISLARMSNVH